MINERNQNLLKEAIAEKERLVLTEQENERLTKIETNLVSNYLKSESREEQLRMTQISS